MLNILQNHIVTVLPCGGGSGDEIGVCVRASSFMDATSQAYKMMYDDRLVGDDDRPIHGEVIGVRVTHPIPMTEEQFEAEQLHYMAAA
jgi:hypothetical protein